MNLSELSRPLTIEDIDFRVQSINKGGYATILAYKSARIDMQRLDAVAGPLGWQRKHELIDGNLHCHVGIYNDDIHEWVWKSDVGTESMTEKEKGQASDSFKRACFNWGIGRELYDYPVISIKLIEKEEYEVDNSGKARQTFGLKIRDWKWHAVFTDGKISYLACKDTKGKLRFEWGERPTKEVQPKVQETAPSVVDLEANIQGFLKKKTDEELDREATVQEYINVIGKKPHHKLSVENMKKEIAEVINDEFEMAPMKTLFEILMEELNTIGTLAELKVWAKAKLEKLEQAEPESVEMFKLACNNYVSKLK